MIMIVTSKDPDGAIETYRKGWQKDVVLYVLTQFEQGTVDLLLEKSTA